MKYILLLSLIFYSFSLKAQTIDTAYKAFPSCKTVSFKNNPRTDSLSVGRIRIIALSIDFTSQVMYVNYQLCTLNDVVLYSNTENLNKIEYVSVLTANKNGTAIIFQYLGTKLKITYQ